MGGHQLFREVFFRLNRSGGHRDEARHRGEKDPGLRHERAREHLRRRRGGVGGQGGHQRSGPRGQQGPAFNHKAQVYAAQGWASLMVNYRGSTGYGQALADKIFVLRGGVVMQAGRPLDLYDDPDNRFVAGFIGSPAMNFFDGAVLKSTGGKVEVAIKGSEDAPLTVALKQDVAAGTPIVIGIRPFDT